MDTSTPAIELRRLRKQFGHVVAVDDVDLTVRQGSVFGFLGPNGAGKTTSLRIMLGLVRPSAGSARVFGRDPASEGVAALEGVAGFVESPTFYPYLSGRRNLRLLADLDRSDDHERIDEVLELVELDQRAGDKVGGYSQGMRQRLGVAAALLRRPRLLLLDEPTNGLDPGGMRDMRGLIENLASEGLTVLLSSHLMGEVEQLCSELAVIARGRIRFAGTVEELRAGHSGHDYRLRVTDTALAIRSSFYVPGVQVDAAESGDLLVRADPDAAARLTVALGRAGVGIYSMLTDTPSLEARFFDLTEHEPGSPAPDAARDAGTAA